MIHIPHSRPLFNAPFEEVVCQVIQSGFLAQGDETTALEFDVGQKLAQRHVLAVDSGTNALMLLIRYLIGNKKGARIGIPAYACASLLFAVKAANAIPILMDCDTSLCLEKTQALKTVKHLDVLVLVHPFGLVDPLAAETFPCPVIEDVAQSAGATLDDKPVGTLTDFSIGSFYATKPWGGAYGGFITCRCVNQINDIRKMCNPDVASLEARYVGHHQLSNLHASVVRKRLSVENSERHQRQYWAQKYDGAMQDLSVDKVQAHSKTHGNYFRYIIQTEQEADLMIQKLQALGISAQKPIQQPLHHSNNHFSCPNADYAWHHCVSLPMLADMSQTEFAHMQQGIQQCL